MQDKYDNFACLPAIDASRCSRWSLPLGHPGIEQTAGTRLTHRGNGTETARDGRRKPDALSNDEHHAGTRFYE